VATTGTSKIGSAHIGLVNVEKLRNKIISTDILILEHAITKNIATDINISETQPVKNIATDINIAKQISTHSVTTYAKHVGLTHVGYATSFSHDILNNIVVDILILEHAITKNISTDIHISETQPIKNISADILVVENFSQNIATDILILEHAITKNIATDIHLTTPATPQTITADIIVYKSPYYYINGTDFTEYIYDVEADGFDLQMNKLSYPNSKDYNTTDQGRTPLTFKFKIRTTDRIIMNEFVNTLLGTPTTFYDGFSDFYYKVSHIEAVPEYDQRRFVNCLKCKLVCTHPWRYADDESTFTATSASLPYTTTSTITNHGHMNCPLYELSVTGIYASSSHLTNVILYVMDGVTAESSLTICDQLNTNEVIVLDDAGNLTCTYTDTFASNTLFTQDATASGCSVSAGKVTMGNNDYFYYKFYGPAVLVDNIKLTANITNVTGNPTIQYSTDGSNWSTAVSTASLTSGSGSDTVYYLSGTKKKSDVYIRFYSSATGTMTINSVKFEAIRDATISSDLPNIPSGESRSIKIDGSGSSTATISGTYRYRLWAI